MVQTCTIIRKTQINSREGERTILHIAQTDATP